MSEDARAAVGDYKAGGHDPENATIRFDFGLSEQVVRDISALKIMRYRFFENSRINVCWGFKNA